MKLAVLEPGHFHAALLQKKMYAAIDPQVRVYARDGPELRDYLQKIAAYNARSDVPTHWQLQTYEGTDCVDRFVADNAAEVAVIAGNNRYKTEYLGRAVAAGMHVLADKPMVIDAEGFAALEKAFAVARQNQVLLYDIMTERHEITTLLQKELSKLPTVFGQLVRGTVGQPAVTKESVHHFSKLVSGMPIRRPAWFFDVAQQGEGLVDITTHLVDLVQWECFPDQIIDYRRDVRIVDAQRWPTELTASQFASVTGLASYPDFLGKDVMANGNLRVFANGEINYVLNGVHAKVSVIWNFAAPEGSGDTHYSIMRGTQANLVIRQGAIEAYQPVLYVEGVDQAQTKSLARALEQALPQVQQKYPGIDIRPTVQGWEVIVPARYHVGHEAHFGQVADQFLGYVERGSLPEWEVPNMLAKYYTTTAALTAARASMSGAG
ncbi:MAG: putative oxidoreductase C-terminal domain-containing protein [Casimicrobiaceae bacterium]